MFLSSVSTSPRAVVGEWVCRFILPNPVPLFFFLPTSSTSQALLFPTRRNLKPKSMGKQQSNSSCAKNWGCCQAVPQDPYAVTNYMQRLDWTAHGASHARYSHLLMLVFPLPLKEASSKTCNQFKSNLSLKPSWGSASSRKPPPTVLTHRYPPSTDTHQTTTILTNCTIKLNHTHLYH